MGYHFGIHNGEKKKISLAYIMVRTEKSHRVCTGYYYVGPSLRNFNTIKILYIYAWSEIDE